MPKTSSHPLILFQEWFDEAVSAGIPAPEAMTLATATRSGIPSARVVLLKEATTQGFYFYTNYESRKSRELDRNPRAALVFYWEKIQKQVRVEGKIVRTTRAESDRYFASRERGSQLGAWASEQSRPIASREDLENQLRTVTEKYEGKKVPRPPHWGGFRIVPERIEFWVAGKHRLHDRYSYVRKGSRWSVTRLSP